MAAPPPAVPPAPSSLSRSANPMSVANALLAMSASGGRGPPQSFSAAGASGQHNAPTHSVQAPLSSPPQAAAPQQPPQPPQQQQPQQQQPLQQQQQQPQPVHQIQQGHQVHDPVIQEIGAVVQYLFDHRCRVEEMEQALTPLISRSTADPFTLIDSLALCIGQAVAESLAAMYSRAPPHLRSLTLSAVMAKLLSDVMSVMQTAEATAPSASMPAPVMTRSPNSGAPVPAPSSPNPKPLGMMGHSAAMPVAAPSGVMPRDPRQYQQVHPMQSYYPMYHQNVPVAYPLDPQLSCHHCKTKQPSEFIKRCSNQFRTATGRTSVACRKKFCQNCLNRIYAQFVPTEQDGRFICPSCRGCCRCAICRRERNHDDPVLSLNPAAVATASVVATVSAAAGIVPSPSVASVSSHGSGSFGGSLSAMSALAPASASEASVESKDPISGPEHSAVPRE